MSSTTDSEVETAAAAAVATPAVATPTLIRVKRRRHEDPVEALVVHSLIKKRKFDDSVSEQDGDKKQILFKLAGTLATPLENHSYKDIQKVILKRVSGVEDVKVKSRNTAREKSVKNRYKLVSRHRHVAEAETEVETNEATEELYKLFDVVKDEEHIEKIEKTEEDIITCNGVPMIRVEDDYVYDFYYPQMSEEDDLGQVLVVESGNDLLDYRSNEDELIEDEDEDSNDENNWRNDYPDEEDEDEEEEDEDFGGYGEDFGFGSLKISKAYQESLSDSDSEGLIHSRAFEEDVADLHGTSYAKYKQKMMKDLNNDDDDDDELDEYDFD